MESVSKMLGHKSLRTTQHYAKILNRKVSEDMQLLKKEIELSRKDQVKKLLNLLPLDIGPCRNISGRRESRNFVRAPKIARSAFGRPHS
ncbi:hypothetical protein [Flagellimonas halotolerans]|uniref:Tyr recombinase domain-containing protein n=1 Tax=Flagellimonas halotolerans TaxID=3112164 RepID=A0ABU6ITF3_9FLAO|nr:hypothetical protein [Muricauda sp. SYSU M84420]MEC4266408.1 hypothetical protein [Muricauda sp. SYSU M84420]